jgi:hypothetical protein
MTDRDAFEQAFVAVAYVLGRRGELARGIVEPGAAAKSAEKRLGSTDQRERARALAAGLREVVVALGARRFA